MLFRPSGISSLGLAGLKDLCIGSRSLKLANAVYDFLRIGSLFPVHSASIHPGVQASIGDG